MSSTALETAFRTVHRQLKPRTPLPVIEATFFPSVAANHSAVLEDGKLQVRISDLFDDAPDEVLEALAGILLSRLFRKKVDSVYRQRYRLYTLSPRMLERSRETRQRRGRKRRRTGPQGKTYDLDRLFRELNREYFDDLLPTPGLSWSQRSARSVLGRYEFEDDVIVVSRFLDSPRVPDYVVRYILFHEMLHVKYGSKIEGTREVVHPPEFQREEKSFERYSDANQWLRAN
jgi:predicted metal-dependent hydrolase